MDATTLIALADPARWRLVALLAERPRPVGILAKLADARQPQTSKHLQTLEQARVVTSQRDGQRRVYALRPTALRELAAHLVELADAAERPDGALAAHDRYGRRMDVERSAAVEEGWADGRSFRFSRALPAGPSTVWRHLTEEPLLARWWAPEGLRLSRLEFSAQPGSRIVQEFRDAEDADGTDEIVGRAEGVIEQADAAHRLVYRMWPLLPDGGRAFTARVELRLTPSETGTELEIDYRITDSTTAAADFVAGIQLGFEQTLDRLGDILADAVSHRPDEARPRR